MVGMGFVLHFGDCWIALLGSAGLQCGVFGYMVECWIIWWGLFGSIMGHVRLHVGECWVILSGVGVHGRGVFFNA